jgi:lysozyme
LNAPVKAAPARPPRPLRSIIDISHWEGQIDFAKVAAAGIVAVIAKATQGSTAVDEKYAVYKNGASGFNFLWGSYHFGTGSEASTQVDHYLTTAQPGRRELVCLDFERNPNRSTMSLEQAREFVSLVHDRLGRWPVLYAGSWLKENLKTADEVLSQCPLWLAQYGRDAVLPLGWKKFTLWQYTDGRTGPGPRVVPGIGPCDRNQFNGTAAALRRQWPF